MDLKHCDELAQQLILSNPSDKFLTEPARLLFSGIVEHLRKESQCSVAKIFESVSTMDLKTLHAKFVNTDIAGFINPKSEKSAQKIRNHIADNLTCLEPLVSAVHDKPFSIKRWMQDPNQTGWLFIQANHSQWPQIKSLFSCWMSIAMKNRKEQQPPTGQHVWFMIEDLDCLDKLPDLLSFLADGDKNGACVVVGLQDVPRLSLSYDHRIVENLFEACETKIIFRCSSFMAGKFSDMMYRQGQPGKFFPTPYELMNLLDFISLVQLPNGYPVIKVQWENL